MNGDGTGQAPNGRTRSRRSQKWAGGLAIVVALVASPPIVVGFDWPVVWLGYAIVGLGVALAYVNGRTAVWMNNRLGVVSMPRLVLAVLLAAPVAAGATLWYFHGDVSAVQTERDPVRWTEETERLRAERAADTAVLAQIPPAVFQDPEVIRLQQELSTVESEFRQADKDVLCEEDGTCGTRRRGRADVYYSKVDRRESLRQQVVALKSDLAREKDRVTTKAEEVIREQSRARDRVHEIDERLSRLGPVRPSPPSRMDVLFTITDRHPVRVGGVFTALFFGFIAFDWGVFTTVVRRFLRRASDTGGSISAKVNERAEKSARGVKNYVEWTAAAPDTNRSTGSGE